MDSPPGSPSEPGFARAHLVQRTQARRAIRHGNGVRSDGIGPRSLLKQRKQDKQILHDGAVDDDLTSHASLDLAGDASVPQVIDLQVDGVLVHVPSSHRVFLLSSLFADAMLLGKAEREGLVDFTISQGEGDLYSVVHIWAHKMIFGHVFKWIRLIPSTKTLLKTVKHWCGCVGVTGADNKQEPQLELFCKSPHLWGTSHVGLYTPVPPPKARAILQSGSAKASSRIVYEAATIFADEDDFKCDNHAFQSSVVQSFHNRFFCEGSLRVGTDPLEHYNRRPPLCYSAEHNSLRQKCSHLEFIVRQPGIAEHLATSPLAELSLQVKRIALLDHPLFSSEDRLYAQLRLLYGEYHRHLKAQKCNYFKLRLQTLLSTAKLCEQSTDQCPGSSGAKLNKKLGMDCILTLSMLAAEEQSAVQLAEALYTTWNQLKGLRQHQQFTSTPAKLVAINVRGAHHPNSATNPLPSNVELLDKFEAMLGWIATHACFEKNNSVSHSRTKLEHSCILSLFKKYKRILISTSDFVLKLYTTAELTYDDNKILPIQEVMRRRRVRQQRLYAKLVANGRQVNAMQAQAIEWPAFIIQLDQTLRLRVSKRPVRFEIQLWQLRVIADLQLASIFVPVPGMSPDFDASTTYSLAPVTEWIQFASSRVKWDVNFVIGDDVEVFLVSNRSNTTRLLHRITGQEQNGSDGAWVAGVIVAVRWNCYDVHVQNRLLRAIPPSRVRRNGAIFEVRQRQLTGSALVSLQWVTNDTRLGALGWADPQTSGGYAEMPNLPPRPKEAPSHSNSDRCSLLTAEASHPYSHVSENSYRYTRKSGSSSSFDPNDPRNASLLTRVIASAMNILNLMHVFRIDGANLRLGFSPPKSNVHASHESSSRDMSEDHTYQCSSFRHRLLRLRANQPKLFTEPIPASEGASFADARLQGCIAANDKRSKRAVNVDETTKGVSENFNARSGQKTGKHVLAFVQRVQDCVAERSRSLTNMRLPLGALVSEGTPLPQLRSRGLVDVALEFTSRRRRSLRPPRQRRSAIVPLVNDCSLLVQVISAHHRPLDLENTTSDQTDFKNLPATSRQKASSAWLDSGSFVSATFQEHRRRTMLAMGHTPRWKEILDLPFTPPLGDFSPTNLMQVSDTLRLGLFSETMTASARSVEGHVRTNPQRNDNSDETGDITIRRSFVGDLEIPFTTLYCNGGAEGLLEGVFRLRNPAIHLNASKFHVGQETRTIQQDSVISYIHLAIFLRPPLAAPDKLPVVVSSLEEEGLIRYGVNWVQQLRLFLENISDVVKRPVDSRIQNRLIEVFGNNMQGDAVLICRYLTPQQPPPGVDTSYRAARFVSLIPFLDDWQSFGCANLDVWCTSQEFLDIGAGDWEEHGILLHNFVWWLQLEAKVPASSSDIFLVIGSGIPEGDTVYVMQRQQQYSALDGTGILLWNACTGHVFNALDRRCPLVDIGCVVTGENIHANLQGIRALHLLTYNFNDGELWRPFFATKPPNPIACGGYVCVCNPGPVQMSRPVNLMSVQDQRLLYDAPDILYAEAIQSDLANEIKVRGFLGIFAESSSTEEGASEPCNAKREACNYIF